MIPVVPFPMEIIYCFFRVTGPGPSGGLSAPFGFYDGQM